MSMIGILAGAVLNIGLDPLFIFVFDMGVGGAGLATMISQIVSWGLLLILERQRGGIPIRLKLYHPTWCEAKEIIAGGVPSLGRQGLMALSSVLLNNAASIYMDIEQVDSAIAAFSVASRALTFASSIIIGFGQGFQPVCGFNYGAKRPDRVIKAFWFAVGVGTGYALIVSLVGYLFAPEIIALFRKEDALLIEIGAETLRFSCIAFTVSAFTTVSGMFLQAVNYAVPATLVSASRSGLFYVPFLFIFGSAFGRTGLCLTQMAGDLAAFVFAIPFLIYGSARMKKTLNKPANPQNN